MAREKKKVRYNPTTAADTLKPHKDQVSGADAEAADKAGVVARAYEDYAEAMDNYQKRSDTETLANRRAREGAAGFKENDHHRRVDKDDLFDDEEHETFTAVPTDQKAAKK